MTTHVAVKLPSLVLTVMVAVPGFTDVTLPLLFTVATLVSLDDQVTFLLVALDGNTVAVNVCDALVFKVRVDASRVTPVTCTVAAVTVTVQFALNPPSAVVTVMTAVPAATAVTRPLELTVAAAVLLEDQFTARFDALDG